MANSNSCFDAYQVDWNQMPDDLIIHLLKFLPVQDRINAGFTCKHWFSCLKSSVLWQHFEFNFIQEEHKKLLTCLEIYGKWLRSVRIIVNQSESYNIENAIEAILKLAKYGRRLRYFSARFVGQNPLFYAGKDFVDALVQLFTPVIAEANNYQHLIEVDLGGLAVAYDDHLFNLLAEYHTDLRKLNIQNRNLVGQVTSECIMNLVRKCRKLTDIRLFCTIMNDDILTSLAEENRDPVKFISVLCRRAEKYIKDLSVNCWKKLIDRSPSLRVGLSFDHTIPVHKIWDIMNPCIPVSVLRLETFTDLGMELNFVAEHYHNTLEKLSIQTTSCQDLDEVLIKIATCCQNLKVLYVFCVVSEETIAKILSVNDNLRNGNTLLKSVQEPQPWGDPAEIKRIFVDHNPE